MTRTPRYDAVLARVAAGTGVQEVLELQERIELLAEAVAENAALEVGLAARVGAIEQSLVAVVEHHARQARAAREELQHAGADRPADVPVEDGPDAR